MKKVANAKRDRTQRRQNLARAINLTWSSLLSHLADTVKSDGKNGNELFHGTAAREYGEVLYTLTVELEALTKRDFKRIYE